MSQHRKVAGLNQLGPVHAPTQGFMFNPWRLRTKGWPKTQSRHIHAMEARSHQKRAKRPITLPIITIPWATE